MQNVLKRGLGLLIVVGLVVLAGCSAMGLGEKKEADKPLYDRLGGKEAITAVVDDFIERVAADNRINAFFGSTNIPRLKQLFGEQVCEASGGPCKYSGRSMAAAHAGMGVKDADFDALVEDLVATLDKFKVPEREKGELLGALGPLRKDIVTK